MLNELFTIPGDVDRGPRGRTIILISVVICCLHALSMPAILITEPAFSMPSLLISSVVNILCASGAVIVARRGRVNLAGWALVLSIIASLLPPIFLHFDNLILIIYLAIPVSVSAMILGPWQIWLVVALSVAVILARMNLTTDAGAALVPVNPEDLIINTGLALLILGALGQMAAKSFQKSFQMVGEARQAAEDASQRLEQLNASLEGQVAARTVELRAAFDEVKAQSQEKQALLDKLAAQQEVIREMSVPVLPVSAHTLVMPLIGALDSARLAVVQAQALAAIEESRARRLLIDLTGVPVVDTQVAQGLLCTVQAARLLGVTPVLIGIRPEVAQSIVSLGIDLSGVRTAASLESALSA